MVENIPALHGNWIDLLILLVVAAYLWAGWGRGLVLGIMDLGGFILSFVVSLKIYSFVGSLLVDNFTIPHGIANAVGFLLSGFFVEFCLTFLISILYRSFFSQLPQRLTREKLFTKLIRLDRVLGFIPAIGEAFIFTAFILTLLITLPIQGYVKKDIVSSKIGGPLVSNTQGIERQLNSIFGQAVNETLTFLTVNPNPSSGERVNLRFTQKEIKIDEGAEATMFAYVNIEREKAGVKQLMLSPKLRDLARTYAKDMFARGYFSHYNPQGQSPFDRMNAGGISYLAAGENLALAPNVQLAHQGLMNSPGHRANILSSDFGKIGIGVIDGGIYGEMIVQEFID